MDQALHAFRLENERKQLEKIEERKKKNEAKKKEMIVDTVGQNGEVKAQSIKYTGTFDFKANPGNNSNIDDEDMHEPEDIVGWVKSQRKKNGLEISKRCVPTHCIYLIYREYCIYRVTLYLSDTSEMIQM